MKNNTKEMLIIMTIGYKKEMCRATREFNFLCICFLFILTQNSYITVCGLKSDTKVSLAPNTPQSFAIENSTPENSDIDNSTLETSDMYNSTFFSNDVDNSTFFSNDVDNSTSEMNKTDNCLRAGISSDNSTQVILLAYIDDLYFKSGAFTKALHQLNVEAENTSVRFEYEFKVNINIHFCLKWFVLNL